MPTEDLGGVIQVGLNLIRPARRAAMAATVRASGARMRLSTLLRAEGTGFLTRSVEMPSMACIWPTPCPLFLERILELLNGKRLRRLRCRQDRSGTEEFMRHALVLLARYLDVHLFQRLLQHGRGCAERDRNLLFFVGHMAILQCKTAAYKDLRGPAGEILRSAQNDMKG